MTSPHWLENSDIRQLLTWMCNHWLCHWCFNRFTTGWHVGEDGERGVLPCRCTNRPAPNPLTHRKMRLLACACCRSLGDELTGEPAHRAVEVAECYADGEANSGQLARAAAHATAPAARAACQPQPWPAMVETVEAVLERLRSLVEAELGVERHVQLSQVYVNAETDYGHQGRSVVKAMVRIGERRVRGHFAERQEQLLQQRRQRLGEIFFDLFTDPEQPVRIDPDWLLADNGRVRQVAASIYAERCFGDMPILGDALQDAGCTENRLLEHCLEDQHYRGCWLIDALLLKR